MAAQCQLRTRNQWIFTCLFTCMPKGHCKYFYFLTHKIQYQHNIYLVQHLEENWKEMSIPTSPLKMAKEWRNSDWDEENRFIICLKSVSVPAWSEHKGCTASSNPINVCDCTFFSAFGIFGHNSCSPQNSIPAAKYGGGSIMERSFKRKWDKKNRAAPIRY